MTKFTRLGHGILLIIAVCLSTAILPVFAQDKRPPLTNSDVLKLVQAKLPDSTITLMIQKHPSAFDTSPEALISLTQSGVSSLVIEAMIQASVTPAATQAPATGSGAVPSGEGSPSVPSGESSALGVRILNANEASITLTHIFFSNDANNLRIADEHCRKHGKVAQFVARERDRRRYNCVRP